MNTETIARMTVHRKEPFTVFVRPRDVTRPPKPRTVQALSTTPLWVILSEAPAVVETTYNSGKIERNETTIRKRQVGSSSCRTTRPPFPLCRISVRALVAPAMSAIRPYVDKG